MTPTFFLRTPGWTAIEVRGSTGEAVPMALGLTPPTPAWCAARQGPLSVVRRCHLPTTDETGIQTSARNDGGRPCMHLKAIHHCQLEHCHEMVRRRLFSWTPCTYGYTTKLVPIHTISLSYYTCTKGDHPSRIFRNIAELWEPVPKKIRGHSGRQIFPNSEPCTVPDFSRFNVKICCSLSKCSWSSWLFCLTEMRSVAELKTHQIHFRPGLRPGLRWGSLRRSPRSSSQMGGAIPLPIPFPLDAFGVLISASLPPRKVSRISIIDLWALY